MIADLLSYFHMGGYAWYVWTAYASVFIFLAVQWFYPWRRWQKYLRKQQSKS